MEGNDRSPSVTLSIGFRVINLFLGRILIIKSILYFETKPESSFPTDVSDKDCLVRVVGDDDIENKKHT